MKERMNEQLKIACNANRKQLVRILRAKIYKINCILRSIFIVPKNLLIYLFDSFRKYLGGQAIYFVLLKIHFN